MPSLRLRRYAWMVLAYNVLVIAWGAFVRATGSGAGCGRHWPLCNGEAVPRAESIKTVIEASHRVTSGLALVAVYVLAIWTWRATSRGAPVRRAAIFAAVSVSGEALIGAGLVLFELVAHDASAKRALSSILHLGNTFLLLAALAITARMLSRVPAAREPRERLLGAVLGLGMLGVLLLAASGSIAALGDTLFPPHSLREGLLEDTSPVAHAFVRLRVLHPIFALGTGVVVLGGAGVARVLRPASRRLANMLTLLFVAQFCAGLLNVTLLAPVWMQLVHLALADATWITLVLLAWDGVYAPIMSRKGPAPTSEVPPSTSSVAPVT